MRNKILILIVLLLIPMFVYAETCNNDSIVINTISVDKKSNDLFENKEAYIKDNTVNTDIIMYNVGDFVRYKIEVDNKSNEDYIVNEKSINNSSSFFNYSLDGNKKILKAHEKDVLYLNVQYKNYVNSFNGGIYTESNNIVIPLSTNLDNPVTFSSIFVILFIILILIAIIIIFKIKKESLILIVIGVLFIPMIVNAYCEYKLLINSKVSTSVAFNGTGTIYSDNPCGAVNTQFKRGDNINDKWEVVKYKDVWCYSDDYNALERECVYSSEEECLDQEDYYCYIKTDGSWNSCVDGDWSVSSEASCQYKLEDDINLGYSQPGEYICQKLQVNKKCEKIKTIKGDYTTDPSNLITTAYYRYDVENYIIKNSYVCFNTDKEYCLQGDSEDYYEANLSLLQSQNEWFSNNGGGCSMGTLGYDCHAENINYYVSLKPTFVMIPYFGGKGGLGYGIYYGRSECQG